MAKKSVTAKVGEVLDYARTPSEINFLLMYREADAEGKKRITKLLNGAALGLLPPVEEFKAMTPEQKDSFFESLPGALQ